jgi:tripartite-type tricarboxylate transporter receptor subunit TctC
MKILRMACVAAALAWAGHAAADDYPTHSIRMIIPAAPGGAVDGIARVLAIKLSASLGKQVVPENRPGAGTMLASQMTASATPDGYTILVCTSSHAINAAVRKSTPYDSVNAFGFVSLVASVPDMLVVNASSPYKTLADIIAAAKKAPGKVTFGTAGPGSYSDMDAELLKTLTGADLLQVPYRGGTPAVTGLMGNETQMVFLSLPGLVPQIKAGRLRPIAVTTATRSPLFPQVPTMAEAGAPGYDSASWYGVMVPAKTPPAVIALLNQRINEALKQPDVKQQLAALGVDAVGTTPEAFTDTMKKDIARWQQVVEKNPQLRLSE